MVVQSAFSVAVSVILCRWSDKLIAVPLQVGYCQGIELALDVLILQA